MILVTGADGLVGRAVCQCLRDAGRGVIPLVRTRRRSTAAGAIVVDLSKPVDLYSEISREVEVAIHLAAAVPHSPDYPDTEASATITRTIDRNVLNFVKASGRPVVYASSCGIYNRLSPVIKNEDDASVIRIQSPYFAAKFDGEQIFRNEALSVIARLSAPIGPGQPPNLVVGRFLRAARNDESLEIWGSGNREQDFVDVRDVARLLSQAALSPKAGTVNVASGRPTTMLELAYAVIAAAGKGRVTFAARVDPHEGQTARYSIDKAGLLYGWAPQFSLAQSLEALSLQPMEP